MKRKIGGIIVLMLMTTTLASAMNISTQQTIQTKESGRVLSRNTIIVDYQPTPFDRGVDQRQTDNCGHGISLAPPWTYAQSFTPTKETLTAVRLYIFKSGAPPDSVQITVSIRDNLTHADLATKTVDTSVVHIGSGTKPKWVLFDFDDITVTPGVTYFIVCSGSGGDSANTYCWFYNNMDTYTGGEAWIKPDENSVWTTIPYGGYNPQDFCFKTYFLKPFGGSAPTINEKLVNPWLLSLLERFPNSLSILRHVLEN
jgi:hypothetical protein